MNLPIGILFALLSMFGFGTVDYMIGHTAKRIGAFQSSLWLLLSRMAMLIVLAPFLLPGTSVSLYDAAIIIAAGLSATLGALGLSYGMRAGNIAVISPITASYPFITVGLSLVFLSQQITSLQWLFIIFIIMGTVLVSLNLEDVLKSNSRKLHLGVEFALVSLLGWGLFFFLISIVTQRIGWFGSTFLAIFPQTAFVVIYGLITKAKFSINPKELPLFALMGLMALLGFLGFNLGITYTYTAIVTPISAASLVVTIGMVVLFLKERITAYQKLGIAIVIIGVIGLSTL